MTIDEAIAALAKAREEVGGDALLQMVDGLSVVKFDARPAEVLPRPDGDGEIHLRACVYVCDRPQQPGDEDEFDLEEAPTKVFPESIGIAGGERSFVLASGTKWPAEIFLAAQQKLKGCGLPAATSDVVSYLEEKVGGQEVNWDYDTGTCGLARVTVTGPRGGPRFECSIPGKQLFTGDERGARIALESAGAQLCRFEQEGADRCLLDTLRDYIAVLKSALAKYTGPDACEPIFCWIG
jgi:hypothetical protein